MVKAVQGKPVIAKITGLDDKAKTAGGWVGMYAPGTGDTSYKSYVYLRDLRASSSSPDHYEVGVLQESGKFDLRVFGDGGYSKKLAETSLTMVSSSVLCVLSVLSVCLVCVCLVCLVCVVCVCLVWCVCQRAHVLRTYVCFLVRVCVLSMCLVWVLCLCYYVVVM